MLDKPTLQQRLEALADRYPQDSEITQLLTDVKSGDALPMLFVSVGRNGVFDVSSEAATALNVFVLDETLADTDGAEVDLDSDDGTSYRASIKKLAVTATHFDVDQVVAGVENTYANGIKL